MLYEVITVRLLPPGVSLLWSIESGQPASFRLYRAPVAATDTLPNPEFKLIVITSYSIHYTKLYEQTPQET